jgi:hypothetical protein
MTDLIALKTEISVDTFRVYSAMDNKQVTDSLNTVDRTENKDSLSGDEVFSAIESQAVWDGLTSEQRLEFLSLCARDSLNPFGAANVNVVKSVFGSGSVTVSNLNAARVRNVSRATEINIGFVREGDVEYVRNN